MNQTLRFSAVVILALLVLPGLGAETVIDQLYGLRKYDLADAYWAAGQKFADLGQSDRAEQFKAQAKRIFPGFVPGQAPAFQALPAAAPANPEPKVPETAAVREANLQGQKIARLQFQKLLRGYLVGSAPTVGAVLADRVTIQGEATAVSASALAAFISDHPADAGSPDDLFLINTLEIADGEGQKVTISVAANPEASGLERLVPFWKPNQVYTFDRVGDTWKLVAVEGN